MLQVRENEISLRNSSRGPVYLRTLEQRFLTFFTSVPLLVTPKQSSTPYPWLAPGYYKDKVKTNVVLLPFTTTYVTFPSTP